MQHYTTHYSTPESEKNPKLEIGGDVFRTGRVDLFEIDLPIPNFFSGN